VPGFPPAGRAVSSAGGPSGRHRVDAPPTAHRDRVLLAHHPTRTRTPQPAAPSRSTPSSWTGSRHRSRPRWRTRTPLSCRWPCRPPRADCSRRISWPSTTPPPTRCPPDSRDVVDVFAQLFAGARIDRTYDAVGGAHHRRRAAHGVGRGDGRTGPDPLHREGADPRPGARRDAAGRGRRQRPGPPGRCDRRWEGWRAGPVSDQRTSRVSAPNNTADTPSRISPPPSTATVITPDPPIGNRPGRRAPTAGTTAAVAKYPP